jgi:hypothetical protein
MADMGNGRHHAGIDLHLFQGVLQRQRIDDNAEHAHIVRRRPVHAFGGTGHAAEDIPAPTTIQTSTPASTTCLISRATRLTVAESSPYSPSPINISPDIFSKTRL